MMEAEEFMGGPFLTGLRLKTIDNQSLCNINLRPCACPWGLYNPALNPYSFALGSHRQIICCYMAPLCTSIIRKIVGIGQKSSMGVLLQKYGRVDKAPFLFCALFQLTECCKHWICPFSLPWLCPGTRKDLYSNYFFCLFSVFARRKTYNFANIDTVIYICIHANTTSLVCSKIFFICP